MPRIGCGQHRQPEYTRDECFAYPGFRRRSWCKLKRLLTARMDRQV